MNPGHSPFSTAGVLAVDQGLSSKPGPRPPWSDMMSPTRTHPRDHLHQPLSLRRKQSQRVLSCPGHTAGRCTAQGGLGFSGCILQNSYPLTAIRAAPPAWSLDSQLAFGPLCYSAPKASSSKPPRGAGDDDRRGRARALATGDGSEDLGTRPSAPLLEWVRTCPAFTPSAISEVSPTSVLGSDTEEEEGAGRRGSRGGWQEPTASSSRHWRELSRRGFCSKGSLGPECVTRQVLAGVRVGEITLQRLLPET